ncbi:zinc finger protein 91-like [Cheilinus undulatus]|uniref:zinc finger protein 91-like n=1 Tax=Cheilinus undulatus TaxID=241271 RepID=UPI001BD28142|nr:zinc finger protein 91-like [Cheilinus undulatus]
MPGVETLRDFVKQRLTAAAEEIFGVFERTIAEYEEQLCRCKEENERKQKLLDDVQLRFHRADTRQLLVHQEEVPSEQQEWSSSLDQEDTEPPHIKEEEEELWSSQEGLEEFNTINFPFAPVPVKTGDDEEKPQSSQLDEIQSEGMKTGADGEDCGGPGQAWNSEPERHFHSETQDKTEAETNDSDGWRVSMEHDYGFKCVDNFGDERSENDKKSHSCSQCSKTFRWKCHLVTHMRTNHREKPFICPECGKKFDHKCRLAAHMVMHTGEKPFSCPECDKKFNRKSTLTTHIFVHTGEKPFGCSECDKKFNQKSILAKHMLVHTGEKPFSCSECYKKFSQKITLNRHMLVHTGEKPFSCSQCDKKFNHSSTLAKHMLVHTGEKPFSCSQCDKKFNHRSTLAKHMLVHTGEKPFSCSQCDKKFNRKCNLATHMRMHRKDILQLLVLIRQCNCVKMPGVKTLRDFVKQRLTAAAEEIFGVFERTIAEYEEQLCRCKEENERKQKLLDDVQLRFHRADTQQLLVNQEEVPSEQQEWSSSLEQEDMEDTEPPHIKEEEEKLWSSQEELEKFNTIKFPFAPVPVKNEDDEEKPQSSQLDEIQSEGMKTGADGEDCGGPEQAWNSEPEKHFHPETQDKTEDCSEAETDDSGDWRVTMENDYGLNCVKNFGDDRSGDDKKSHSCSQCSKRFRWKYDLATHMRTDHGEKPFSCPECDNQQLSVTPEEVPSEQQEWSSSLDQEDTESPHLKEEEEELWSSQEGLEEFNTIKFPFAPVPVKTEDDEEKPLSSQLDEIQNEEMKTGVDGENCGGPAQARNSEPERHFHSETQDKTEDCSEAETDDSDGWRVTMDHDYGLNCVENFDDDRSDNDKKSHSCSQCSKTFRKKYHLATHMRTHLKVKHLSCSDCGKRFKFKSRLTKHMVIHTGEKPFSCSQCKKGFIYKSQLNTHMFVHTGERPFSCSKCDKKFYHKSSLITHMVIHTGKKRFTCTECDQQFYQKSHLNSHMFLHTGERPFSCSKCDKTFNRKSTLTNHMLIHKEEKPFSCSKCDKKFNEESQLNSHMLVHTGEKLFSCPQCDKKFNRKSHLAKHMVIHTGEKPFSCSECGKKFNQRSHLTSHMVIHTGEKPFSCELCKKKFSWDTQVKRHKCTGGQT